jgi:hypothetical protein
VIREHRLFGANVHLRNCRHGKEKTSLEAPKNPIAAVNTLLGCDEQKEMSMIRTGTRAARVGLLVALLGISLASTSRAAAQQCTASSEDGKWAFTHTGTILLPTGPVPVASVGTFTGKAGVAAGSQTRSVGGDVAQENLTATHSVHADCTATFNFKVFDAGVLVRTATVNIVYDDNGRSARGIFASLALADGTVLPNVIAVRREGAVSQATVGIAEGRSQPARGGSVSNLDMWKFDCWGDGSAEDASDNTAWSAAIGNGHDHVFAAGESTYNVYLISDTVQKVTNRMDDLFRVAVK